MSRTVIGPETRVGGPLRGKDDILVEGAVDGPVEGDATVTIARGARVEGPVHGRDVVVGGTLRHPVIAAASARMLQTAEVYADITAPRIAMDEGAVFEGQMRMGRRAQTVEPTHAVSVPVQPVAASSPVQPISASVAEGSAEPARP